MEKNPVRHNHRHAPGGFERADDMLDKHEIRFALGGHPELVAVFELHAVGGIVLRKGRIGNNNVEPFQLCPLPVLGLIERVAVFNLSIQNVMKEHIEFAQAPGGSVLFLTVESQFSRTAILALDIVERFNQHTARADSGIADLGILRRVENGYQQLDYGARGIEFAPLFPCAVGKVFDHLKVG